MKNFNIVRKDPYSTTYNFYGDPHKLVEYRLLILNKCSMTCKGCFYKKTNNNFNDFSSALNLAKDMIKNDYKMETCYLLPTDIFDNKENYLYFQNKNFKDLLSLFSFVGIASTLENGYDINFLNFVYDLKKNIKIELQVNLLLKKIFEEHYHNVLKKNIAELKQLYKDNIVINLAINTGFKLTIKEKEKLKNMLSELSEDGIIEINFTFLYNDDISDNKKKEMLREGVLTVNDFGKFYEKNASFIKKYNNRTFLRKPSFTFVGNPNRIFVNPIIPFDEYVFIKKERYLLNEPTTPFEPFPS